MNVRQIVLQTLTSTIAVVTFAFSQIGYATCNWSDLPFGFNVGSIDYSIDNSGRYLMTAGQIAYAYDTGGWRSQCGATGYSGSGALEGAGHQAYFSIWAFQSPFNGSGEGYEMARSEPLWLHVWNPNPSMGSPYDGDVVIGYGREYQSPPIQPLATLPSGTWYLTMFLFDKLSANYSKYGNFPTPLVVPSSTPPPTTSPPSTVTPQIGLWADPNESGTGYTLDYKRGTLVVAIYAYTSAGAAQWYLAAGPVTGTTFTATLDKYIAGQCIACAYPGLPTRTGNDGTIIINFWSSTSATVLLPGGRVTQIQPFQF
jgi:hypothetical protein